MKPFKSGMVIAAWLLRIMLVWFIYQHYFKTFGDFDFKEFNFYISTAYLLFGVLVFAGGFLQKPAMTVISGLLIFILPLVQLIRAFPEDPGSVLLVYMIPLAVGFYFFTNGNGS